MNLLDGLLGPPTMARLLRQVSARLRASGWTDLKLNVAMGEVTASKDGQASRFFLGNLLHELRHCARRDRPARIDRFLNAVGSDSQPVPKDYTTARPRLLPVIRAADDLGIAKLTAQRLATDREPWKAWLSRPLVGDLVIAIVCDAPNALAYVTEESLSDWSRSYEEVLEDALSNLRDLPEAGGWKEVHSGVWSGEWGDAYESSRLLLPDLIHRLGVPDPVAMVPFRNSIVVTSARNAPGIAAMAALVRISLETSNRWLSFQPIQLDGQVWRPYEPMPEHRPLFDELRQQEQAATYAQQKELLDDWHQQTGVDIFVASYQLLSRKGESTRSFGTWSKGVDTMLPRSDVVALNSADEQTPLVLVPWDDLIELAGGLMEETDLRPPRWRVRSFPRSEIVEALRTRQPQAGTTSMAR